MSRPDDVSAAFRTLSRRYENITASIPLGKPDIVKNYINAGPYIYQAIFLTNSMAAETVILFFFVAETVKKKKKKRMTLQWGEP